MDRRDWALRCFYFSVPELIRNADIKLNERVLLRRHPRPLSAIILRLAALFFIEECGIKMVWLLALPIICLAAAVFLWRFERHLEQLVGPWISD
jgi:hypothetical protein